MQEFAANVWPELMQKVLAGIAQESEADATHNGVHALALAGDVEVGNGTRSSDAKKAGRVKSLAAAIGTGDQHAAHGIQSTLEERQVRVAKISGVLLEQRGEKKALEENVSFSGSKVDAIGLAHAAETSLIFPIQMMASGPVGGFVNGGIGESARRICAVKKYIELLPCSERLPLSNRRVRFSIDSAVHLEFDHVLHLLKARGLRQQRGFRHGYEIGRRFGGIGGRSWPLRKRKSAGEYNKQNRMEKALHFSYRIAEVEFESGRNPYLRSPPSQGGTRLT